MTFKEVLDMARNIIDEVDVDSQIDVILKNAINYAYLNISNTVDKKSKTIEIPYSKVYVLPIDCNSIIDIFSGDYILSMLDYSVKSDAIIFHKKHNPMTLLYTKTITPLKTDGDILDVDDRYGFACAMYGAYAYSVHRKRIELASLLLSDYNNILSNKKTMLEVNEFESTRNN